MRLQTNFHPAKIIKSTLAIYPRLNPGSHKNTAQQKSEHRKSFSSVTMLRKFKHNILNAMNKGKITPSVITDY